MRSSNLINSFEKLSKILKKTENDSHEQPKKSKIDTGESIEVQVQLVYEGYINLLKKVSAERSNLEVQIDMLNIKKKSVAEQLWFW
jgi:transcription antitermination factor NusG